MKRKRLVGLAALLAAYLFWGLDGSIPRTLAIILPTGESKVADSRLAAGLGLSLSRVPGAGLWGEGGAWTEPLTITTAMVDAPRPMLAVDGEAGRLHLVWEEASQWRYICLDRFGRQIENRHFDGDSPAIALDEDRLPHVVYALSVPDALTGRLHTQIYHRARGPNGWADHVPRLVSRTAGNSTDPDIALLLDDALNVVWAEQAAGSTYLVYHARSTDEVNWAMEPVGEGYAPAVTLLADGRPWVAWQQDQTTPRGRVAEILAAQWYAGFWSLGTNISSSPTSDSTGADIVSDAAGSIHVAWTEGPVGARAVLYASRAFGVWSTPITLSAVADLTAPQLVVGADGTLYAAWGVGPNLAFRSKPADGAWEALPGVVGRQARVGDVSIAVDAEGTLYALWSARSPTRTWSLYYSRWTPEARPTPTITPTLGQTASPTLTPMATETPTMSQPTSTLTVTETPTVSQPTSTLTATETPSPSASATATPPPRGFLPLIVQEQAGSQPTPQPERTPTPSRDMPRHVPTRRAQTLPMFWQWSPTESVSSAPADSRAPALAVAPDGTAYAVWREPLSAGLSILCYSVRRGGAWSAPTYFFLGEEPDLAVGPDGTVHLAYTNQFAGNYEIYHTTWGGGGWRASENVSYTSGTSSQPAIAAKSDGTLVLVWTDTTEGPSRIYYAWRANGVWNSYFVPATRDGSAPDVAVGEHDTVWVTWQLLEDDQYDVYALRGDGRNWDSMAINISDSPNADSMAPRLAGTKSRGSFLVWQEDAESGSEVYYADNLAYLVWWGVPANLSQTGPRSEQPAIVANAWGDVHVAWDEGNQLLHRYREPTAGTWSAVSTLATSTLGIGEVALSAGLDHRLRALYAQPLAGADRDIVYRSGSWQWPYYMRLPLLYH